MVLVYHRVLQISFKEIQADLKRVFTYAGMVSRRTSRESSPTRGWLLVYHRVLLISFEDIQADLKGVFTFVQMSQ